MDEQQVTAPSPEQQIVAAIQPFFDAMFEEHDTMLLRPVVSYTENGKKRTQVLYKSTLYRGRNPVLMLGAIPTLLRTAEQHQANLYFGVCPRVGPRGRFDLAWQIRTVRVLWADIDHVTIEEALARVRAAGLPEPSIVVNSGNGVHLYWILDVAYLIDDAGPAIPVETEWVKQPDGRKKPRKYIVEDGERVYLDDRRHVKRLSGKAQYVQNLLSGIAQAIGGDHTTDLARLLRIPYTLNRKDQRNGKEPKPTELVICDPSRRYAITEFERFAKQSDEAKKQDQIAKMPLPQVRKASAGKSDKLADLVAQSSIAPAGTRSEADFAVCCFAIRNGIGKEEVWPQVADIGKFAERGREYFDRTWENAEYDVREAKYEKLITAATPAPVVQVPGVIDPSESGANDGEPPTDDELGDDDDDPRKITFDATNTPVAWLMSQITDRLLRAGTCFNRAEQICVVTDDRIEPVLSSAELAGLLNQYVEFYFVGEESGEYKPLPPMYANPWLHHAVERARFPSIRLFTRNPVYTDDWRLVAPGYDPDAKIYYAGPPIEPRVGTEHLTKLLKDFCFKDDGSRTNYLGMLLTTVLIPRFIGSKPAALFNGNQPGLGKTILAQIIATFRDGRLAETVTYNPNDEEFEKRLGSLVRRGATTIVIDNAKSGPRGSRIDSACLERSLTDPILSFRLLGQSEQIRAENSHIFCITANSADVSRDLVTRSTVINLFHEGDPKRRSFSMDDPEGYAMEHRSELLGELMGMVEHWKSAGMPLSAAKSRFNKLGWAKIVGGILEASGFTGFLQNAEEAAMELDEARREFGELVAHMARHKQGIWTPAELGDFAVSRQLFMEDLYGVTPRALATRMGLIAGRYVAERFPLDDEHSIAFLKESDRKGTKYRVAIEAIAPQNAER